LAIPFWVKNSLLLNSKEILGGWDWSICREKPVRTGCQILVYCCLLFVAVTATACQDKDTKKVDLQELVSRIKSKTEARSNLFVGLSAKSNKTVSRNGLLEKTVEYSFSQLQIKTWRSELQAKVSEEFDQRIISARNEDFCFNASKEPSGDYVFWLLGYDQEIQEKIESNLWNQFPFALVPGYVNTVPLELFLTAPRLTATWITGLDDHLGKPVEGISFRFPYGGGIISGELHWLPEDGYLLRRILANNEITTPEGEVEVHRSVDKTISYNIVSGRVLPWSITAAFNNGRTVTHQISSVSDAVADPKYYTPESIGLATPKRPTEKWFVWACVAVSCLVGSIVFYVWGGAKNQPSQVAKNAPSTE
jgi:hypothetical protein